MDQLLLESVTENAKRNSVLPTYRRIKPKTWPDLYYWVLVGVAAFLTGEVLVRVNHGKYLLIARLAGAFGFMFLPLSYLAFCDRFRTVMNSLKPVLWDQDFDEWLRNRMQLIFTLRPWKAKLLTEIALAAGVATVVHLGLPLRTHLMNSAVIAGFIPLLLICGQGAYICLALLWVLRDIAGREPRVAFWLMPHPAILELHAYYGFVGMMYACAYAVLALGIWWGPWGFAMVLQVWLAILAFIPLSLFIWSFLQVHILLRKVKQQHLKLANEEVQRAWRQSCDKRDMTAVPQVQQGPNHSIHTGASNPVRTLIAENSAAPGAVIKTLIELEECIEIVGKVTDGQEAMEAVSTLKPDSLLIDARLPDIDGSKLLRRFCVSLNLALSFVLLREKESPAAALPDR